MNSILIAMFVFICGLVILLMYQISRLMEMQEDLREQHDEIRKIILASHERLLNLTSSERKHFDIIESSLFDLDRKIDILHELLNEYTDTIIKAVGRSNGDIDAISSYLEIMKNTILDMHEKMNIPTYGGEVNDTEEADLMPENWPIATPIEDENM